MALLGRSRVGGSSISISLLCLYLSGRDGEPTANTKQKQRLGSGKHFVAKIVLGGLTSDGGGGGVNHLWRRRVGGV